MLQRWPWTQMLALLKVEGQLMHPGESLLHLTENMVAVGEEQRGRGQFPARSLGVWLIGSRGSWQVWRAPEGPFKAPSVPSREQLTSLLTPPDRK